MEIYPSILVDDYQEFEKRIQLLGKTPSLLHIDLGDGIFVPHKSFQDIEKVTSFPWEVSFELHFMLTNPDTSILPWLKTPAKRIIFHWEAKEGSHTWVHGLLKKIKQAGKEAGIGLNPKTSQEKIYAFLGELDLVLIMSVEPGFSGQIFMPEVIPKIKALREKGFVGIIEVDGGMNEKTIPFVKEAGASAAAVASAIFERDDPREALYNLKRKIES